MGQGTQSNNTNQPGKIAIILHDGAYPQADIECGGMSGRFHDGLPKTFVTNASVMRFLTGYGNDGRGSSY